MKFQWRIGREFVEERNDGARRPHQQRLDVDPAEPDRPEHRALHLPAGSVVRRPAAQAVTALDAAFDAAADAHPTITAAQPRPGPSTSPSATCARPALHLLAWKLSPVVFYR